jgi:hypothetical protein
VEEDLPIYLYTPVSILFGRLFSPLDVGMPGLVEASGELVTRQAWKEVHMSTTFFVERRSV